MPASTLHKALRRLIGSLALIASFAVAPLAQVREYDWYPSFRSWMQASVPNHQRNLDALTTLYRAKLTTEEGRGPSSFQLLPPITSLLIFHP